MSTHCRGRQGHIWIRLTSALAFALFAGPVFAAQLSLSWSDNATNESGSRIERRLNVIGSPFSEIGTVGPNITTYSDTSVTAGLGYCYRVRAYNSAGSSGYSNEACSTATNPPPPPPPPSGGLVAAYGFDEGSGSTVGDASSQGNAGTVSGATWTNQGRFGNALVFDGVNDWVTVPHSGSLSLTTGMTVMAWVYPTTTSGKRDVLIKEGALVDIYNLYSQNELGFPEANVFVGGVNQIAQGSPLPASTWTHLASTYDGTTLKLFVNGSQAASSIVPGAIALSTGALRIGGNSLWGEFFQGRIDEVRVYNRALSASEIGTDLNTAIGSGSPPPPPPPSVTLTVTKSGTGTVTSTSPAAAINCGADCSETVPSGTAITLAAAPGTGFAFTGWSGGGCSGTGGCTVTLAAATTVTATFASTVTLTVTKSGTGTVTSTSPAAAINCGADCSETVPSGTAITLAAAPGTGFAFTGWSGGGCSGTGGCTVTLAAATTVTATFASTVTLTVTKSGTGTVTSTSPAAAINCGADCSETVPSGTAITLAAAPGTGFAFTGWSGGGCSGTGGCSVTLAAATTVTATFASTVTLTVTKSGTGTVTSTSPAAAINCGADCSETVPSGTAITLAAAPGTGFAFSGWSGGGCSGTGGCTVTPAAATTVTATFASTSTATLQFSLANYSAPENDGSATVTVTRSVVTNTQVQVHYETSNGSAVADVDYTHASGDLVFTPGQTSRSFTVPVKNNTIADGPRTVVLRLSNPQSAQLGAQPTAILTIQDNDGGGTIAFGATAYSYPDVGGTALITVTRSDGGAGGVSVKYRTGSAGTAAAGTDYVAISSPQLLTFAANETSKTFPVQVVGNTVAGDSSKTVQLLLSDASGGATLGSRSSVFLTLTNNDAGGSVRFSASGYAVAENAGQASITVNRTGGAASNAAVQVVATNGTAALGVDYGAPSVTSLTFAANEAAKTFTVPILSNPTATGSRALTLKLQGSSGGAALGNPNSATLTISKVGIRFSQTVYTVAEGPGSATITVLRAGTSTATVQVQTLNDSATAPADYTAISPPQVLTFSGSGASRTFTVAIANNQDSGTNRSLRLRLLNAAGEPLGEPREATLTILDKQKPELRPTAFGPPTSGLAGKTIAVPNTVQNLSGLTAAASTLRFVLSQDAIPDNGNGVADDVVLGTRSVPSLGTGASSGATTTLTIPGGINPGAYTLFAIVDAGKVVAEQDETNNVASAPITILSNLVRTFGVSGGLTNVGCTSPLRNGRVVALGSMTVSSQTGSALSGTLALTFPRVPGLQTSGPFQATLDTAGALSGTIAYTTRQGSAVVSAGTGSLTGTVNGSALDVDVTGYSASGETCDFTGWVVSPGVPLGFMAFHHDAMAGALGEVDGAFVATPTFPTSLDRYRALFEITGDTAPFAATANVLFTGPAGSQLSNTAAAELSQVATNIVEYRSPFVASPRTAPGGAWSVHHEGEDYDYSFADPQAEARLVVPVPAFAQVSGQLQQVTWSYKAPNGAPLSGPPAFMRQMRLQILNGCGTLLHDSLALTPTTTSRTLSPSVTLGEVAEVRFQYVDDWENMLTVRYGNATPGNCKVVEFGEPSFSAEESSSSANITIRRGGDLTGTVTVNFTTSNGTAQQGQHYTNANQVVTLGPNVQSRVVDVPIINNGTSEAARTVLLGLHGPGGGATLGPLNTAVLTINDDDPRIRFSSTTYSVGEDQTTATITVQRTGATAPVVSVPYATSDGTALAGIGLDYLSTTGLLTFVAGQTSKTFTVSILNDTLAEGNQTVNLTLGTPTGALLGSPDTATLTITDNESGGAVAFSSPTFSVSEDGGTVTITVVRTGGTGGDTTVRYATSNGTGVAGTDYTATSGTLTFGAGEMSKTFTVPVRVNAGSAANKSVGLTLSSPSTGATLGAPSTATLWIVSQ